MRLGGFLLLSPERMTALRKASEKLVKNRAEGPERTYAAKLLVAIAECDYDPWSAKENPFLKVRVPEYLDSIEAAHIRELVAQLFPVEVS